MITELRTALRLRRHTMPELISAAGQPLKRRAKCRPPVTAALVMRRLASGFGTPVEENAALVAALRAGGHAAQLIVGAEPLPANDGEYPIVTWVAIDGRPLELDRPPDILLVEVTRFPEKP
ncbi:hypothetical protein [Streptomyces lavendofoliae]|uniref:hypothetical protein n=1 Tax=Streptomyces lavendofoliae TaxID=67314 RepID=UPI00300EABF3